MDTSDLLFGVKFKIQIQHRPVLHLASQPPLKTARDGYAEGECKQALCHPAVTVYESDVGYEHEVLEQVAARTRHLHPGEPHHLRFASPSLILIRGRGRRDARFLLFGFRPSVPPYIGGWGRGR